MHCVGFFYTQGITCKYLHCDDWTCDAAMSKVYGEKNDRSCSPLVLTSHIFQESLCHNDQQIIAINSKLLQQTLVATKFFIAINSKLLQQTPLTMKIFVAHYCNKVCGNRLLQPKKKKKKCFNHGCQNPDLNPTILRFYDLTYPKRFKSFKDLYDHSRLVGLYNSDDSKRH